MQYPSQTSANTSNISGMMVISIWQEFERYSHIFPAGCGSLIHAQILSSLKLCIEGSLEEVG